MLFAVPPERRHPLFAPSGRYGQEEAGARVPQVSRVSRPGNEGTRLGAVRLDHSTDVRPITARPNPLLLSCSHALGPGTLARRTRPALHHLQLLRQPAAAGHRATPRLVPRSAGASTAEL